MQTDLEELTTMVTGFFSFSEKRVRRDDDTPEDLLNRYIPQIEDLAADDTDKLLELAGQDDLRPYVYVCYL